MIQKKDLKKTLGFILIPLLVFMIPIAFAIVDKIEQKELESENVITIGRVKESKFRGFKNIVTFEYEIKDSLYITSEYTFNGEQKLPISLPIYIKVSIKNPKIYNLMKDSIIVENNDQIRYFKKFNGGWTYEITSIE